MLFLIIGLLSSVTSCSKDDDASGDFDNVVVTVTNNCSSDLRFYFFNDFEDLDLSKSVGYSISKSQQYVDKDEFIRDRYDHPVGIQVADSIIIVKQYDAAGKYPNKFLSEDKIEHLTLYSSYEFNDEYLRSIYETMVARGILPIKCK